MSVVLVYTLGATALQKFNPGSGRMELQLSPGELLASAAVPQGIEARIDRAFPFRCIQRWPCHVLPMTIVDSACDAEERPWGRRLASAGLAPS